MQTVFYLSPKRKKKYDLQLERFQNSLPLTFKAELKNEKLYVSIPTSKPEDDGAQYLIDRELDRLYYFTNVRLVAHMLRRTVRAELTVRWKVQASLPDTVAPAAWTYELALQLRLWAMSSELTDPIAQMLLLFQVIELSHPHRASYPEYRDSSQPPHPLTECRLIRNMIAHAGEVQSVELKRYCAFLGLPDLMLDRTDQEYVGTISSKLQLLKNEAQRCIANAA